MSANKPGIRFKGFSEEWERRKIGDIFNEKKRAVDLEDNKVYQLVTVKRRNEGVVSRGMLNGKQILVKSYFEINAGDFIISKRQVVHGANGIVPECLNGAIVSNEYLVATEAEHISSKFWSIISKRPDMYKKFFVSSYGVDIEKLVFDVGDWKKRFIIIPHYIEQNKIIIFFNQLDRLIVTEQSKYDKLLNIKKACLEKMFPKEGTTTPEVRFKGFSGEWQYLKFDEVAATRRGLTYKPLDVSNSGIRVLRSSNIEYDSFLLNEDDVFVIADSINISYAKNDEILITSANGSSKLVGKHAIIKGIEINNVVHGGFMLIASSKSPYFLNASMSSIWYKKFIATNALGGNGAIGNLSKSNLDKYSLLVPIYEEQTKIGDFFKHLDQLISLRKTQLDKLKNIKKACLEKMFV